MFSFCLPSVSLNMLTNLPLGYRFNELVKCSMLTIRTYFNFKGYWRWHVTCCWAIVILFKLTTSIDIWDCHRPFECSVCHWLHYIIGMYISVCEKFSLSDSWFYSFLQCRNFSKRTRNYPTLRLICADQRRSERFCLCLLCLSEFLSQWLVLSRGNLHLPCNKCYSLVTFRICI